MFLISHCGNQDAGVAFCEMIDEKGTTRDDQLPKLNGPTHGHMCRGRLCQMNGTLMRASSAKILGHTQPFGPMTIKGSSGVEAEGLTVPLPRGEAPGDHSKY